MAIFMQKSKETSKLTTVIDTLLHEGIYTYNQKKSKALSIDLHRVKQQEKRHRKGAIFAVRSKEDFTTQGVKGYIITSKETLLAHANKITHFTPNVYRRFTYTDDKRTYIKGFEEQHLQQINAFVIDIDTKDYTVNEILLACLDESIGLPTLILESTRGYQVYFALSAPIFISNEKDYISLKVAKRIAENLKLSLASVKADKYCNDFGFFRMPTEENIRYFDANTTYNVKQLINWSQQQDDNVGRQLYVVPKKTHQTSLMQTQWFYELIQTTNVQGQKGQIGRNNVLFTLALVCYQDGCAESAAFDLLDQYNATLASPLDVKEIKTLLASAYSGRYHGAKKEYIEEILALYGKPGAQVDVSFGQKFWYKHKKARADRERSHFNEWEEDICAWIKAEKSISEPFIWRTQKELCAAIGIASSSLNKLLQNSTKIIKTTTGKGRNAKTGWTTVEDYLMYVIWLQNDMKARFADAVREMIAEQLDSMERIAGYTTLVHYIERLRADKAASEQLFMYEIFEGVG